MAAETVGKGARTGSTIASFQEPAGVTLSQDSYRGFNNNELIGILRHMDFLQQLRADGEFLPSPSGRRAGDEGTAAT